MGLRIGFCCLKSIFFNLKKKKKKKKEKILSEEVYMWYICDKYIYIYIYRGFRGLRCIVLVTITFLERYHQAQCIFSRIDLKNSTFVTLVNLVFIYPYISLNTWYQFHLNMIFFFLSKNQLKQPKQPSKARVSNHHNP